MDMDNLKACQEKVAYSNQFKATDAGMAVGGSIGTSLNERCRENLTERVRSQFHRSARESRKADRMNELLHLLEKNPEVARILDLVEEVKY